MSDKNNFWLTDNPYGYKININHPQVTPLYERYKAWIGIPHTTPMSDDEREEFENYIIKKVSHDQRLQQYHRERQKLISGGMSAEEYAQAIALLAKKWRVSPL